MRRSFKYFDIVVPCALGVLGLFVGLSSLWEQNMGSDTVRTFIIQSLRNDMQDETMDAGTGEISVCDDNSFDILERCETDEQCVTGSSCVGCVCRPNLIGS